MFLNGFQTFFLELLLLIVFMFKKKLRMKSYQVKDILGEGVDSTKF